jgi:phosphonoacetate hydrolase
VGDFHNSGAIVGITADHGMNQKTHFDSTPNVTFLGTELDSIGVKSKVILPITDPYVAHHGALGGFATIHLDRLSYPNPEEFDVAISKAYAHLRSLKGCYSVIGRDDAKRGLDLPEDRIGDIVVLGHKNSVFGTRPEEHDLSQLHGEVLRSHGSLEESLVPLIYNRPVVGQFLKQFGRGKIRNFDLFYGLLNGVGI